MIVRKPSDTSRSSLTTPADDPHLLFAVGAGEIWEFEVVVFLVGPNTSADWKVGFSGPSGSTVTWGCISGQQPNFTTQGTGGAPSAMNTAASTMTFAGTANLNGVVLKGIIVNGATPGNLAFQWSQNTTDAGSSTVKANSFIKCRQLN